MEIIYVLLDLEIIKMILIVVNQSVGKDIKILLFKLLKGMKGNRQKIF